MTHAPSQPVLELRRYTLHPGQRQTLVDLFDRHLVEPQEAAGMQVVGQFTDVDDPQRFVWLRAFACMAARLQALQAFYGGPVWAAHRDAANATMIDSDDVHLLQPAWAGACALLEGPGRRAAVDIATTRGQPPGAARVLLYPLRQPAGQPLLQALRTMAAAQPPSAWLVTEPAANDFPRLPVHQGLPVVVRVSLHADLRALDADMAGPAQAAAEAALHPWLSGPPVLHRLRPTARSALHA